MLSGLRHSSYNMLTDIVWTPDNAVLNSEKSQKIAISMSNYYGVKPYMA